MHTSELPQPSDPSCALADHARRKRQHAPVPDGSFERVASLFRISGDVERLKLMYRLVQTEWSVSDLAAAAGARISTVSKQLKVLSDENLVTRRRSGKRVYYAITDRRVIDMVCAVLDHASEDVDAKLVDEEAGA